MDGLYWNGEIPVRVLSFIITSSLQQQQINVSFQQQVICGNPPRYF